MGWQQLITAVAVLLISAWLARGVPRGAQVALWVSAMLVSAGMFLPSSTLRGLIGRVGLTAISSVVSASPWTVDAVGHFTAFLWLALVLWTLRPDLRGWKSIVLLAVLAIASELMQGLSAERSTRFDDVAVNMLGGGVGLILGVVTVQVWKRSRRVISSSDPGQ